MGNKYPDWEDLPVEQIMYGLGAPLVGIGVYTLDKKLSWPDPEGTTKEEYDRWAERIAELGYEVPEKYLNAYVKA
ncbi:MAG: hypothetical protein AAGB31_15845, partial [Bdellovibrio sp.]